VDRVERTAHDPDPRGARRCTMSYRNVANRHAHKAEAYAKAHPVDQAQVGHGHGMPVGTKTTSSRSNDCATSLAATRWPWWIGSNVPPRAQGRGLCEGSPRRPGAGGARPPLRPRYDNGARPADDMVTSPIAMKTMNAIRPKMKVSACTLPWCSASSEAYAKAHPVDQAQVGHGHH
jgi:hypothetical protein